MSQDAKMRVFVTLLWPSDPLAAGGLKTFFLPTSCSCGSHNPVKLYSSTTSIFPSRWRWEPDFWSGLCFCGWNLLLQ